MCNHHSDKTSDDYLKTVGFCIVIIGLILFVLFPDFFKSH